MGSWDPKAVGAPLLSVQYPAFFFFCPQYTLLSKSPGYIKFTVKVLPYCTAESFILYYIQDLKTLENEDGSLVSEKQDKYFSKNKFNFHPRLKSLTPVLPKEMKCSRMLCFAFLPAFFFFSCSLTLTYYEWKLSLKIRFRNPVPSFCIYPLNLWLSPMFKVSKVAPSQTQVNICIFPEVWDSEIQFKQPFG